MQENGGTVVRNARAITFQLVEVAVSGDPFQSHPGGDPSPACTAGSHMTVSAAISDRKSLNKFARAGGDQAKKTKQNRSQKPEPLQARVAVAGAVTALGKLA